MSQFQFMNHDTL